MTLPQLLTFWLILPAHTNAHHFLLECNTFESNDTILWKSAEPFQPRVSVDCPADGECRPQMAKLVTNIVNRIVCALFTRRGGTPILKGRGYSSEIFKRNPKRCQDPI